MTTAKPPVLEKYHEIKREHLRRLILRLELDLKAYRDELRRINGERDRYAAGGDGRAQNGEN